MGNTQDEILQRYATWLKIERGNNESTIRNTIGVVKRFFKWLRHNGYEIEQINQKIIDEYLYCCYQKYAANSMIPITISLRKFCCHFLRKDVRIKVAIAKPPNRDKTALTKEEIKAMFEVVKDKPLDLAILKTLYYTGMRSSELINLDIEDVDFSRLQITIKHGKGGKYRIVNITRDCALAIRRWLEARPSARYPQAKNALFLSPTGNRLNHSYLNYLVKRTAAKAGITKHVYPHKFRISMITIMAEEGLSPKEIQVQSGHRDIKTLIEYVQHVPSRIRKAYERVFDDADEIYLPEKRKPIMDTDPEYFKKLAIEKYLMGEMDADELSKFLKTIDNNKKESGIKPTDIAYL